MNKVNREQWLTKLGKELERLFKRVGAPALPAYRVTCGWPSRKALTRKNKAIGQCFDKSCSKDKTTELIISMYIDQPLDAAEILAHEMIHASVGNKAGHGKPFRDVAIAIGLTGKMTKTVAGPEFVAWIKPVLKKLGKYPHAMIDAAGATRKQGTRLIKVACAVHPEYSVRMSQKWISDPDFGPPLCPHCTLPMFEAGVAKQRAA
jgi:hypothetical protein